MATFVQLSENDPAYHLVELICKLKYKDNKNELYEKLMNELNILVKKQSYNELLNKAVFNNVNEILSSSAHDINTVYNLSFSLVNTLSIEEANNVIQHLLTDLSSNTDHPKLKLKLLTTLFNITSTQPYSVLLTILNYALKTDKAEVLTDQLDNVDTWIKSWKVSSKIEASICLSVGRVYGAIKKYDQQQKYYYRYFKIIENVGDIKVAKEYVIESVLVIINSLDITSGRDLLQYKVIDELKNDKDSKLLLTLLEIVLDGSVKDYIEFEKNYSNIITKYNIDHNVLLSKMRTAAICSLATDKQLISYDELKVVLNATNDNEIEQYFIEAYMSQHVDGRLDQENRTLTVNRYSQRSFGDESWTKLEKDLSQWKENVNNILTLFIRLRQQ